MPERITTRARNLSYHSPDDMEQALEPNSIGRTVRRIILPGQSRCQEKKCLVKKCLVRPWGEKETYQPPRKRRQKSSLPIVPHEPIAFTLLDLHPPRRGDHGSRARLRWFFPSTNPSTALCLLSASALIIHPSLNPTESQQILVIYSAFASLKKDNASSSM
jgi:hypothetical protein